MENLMQEKKGFHGDYCLRCNGPCTVYDRGEIASVSLALPEDAKAQVTVRFANGKAYSWENKWLTSYVYQFGVAVSADGNYLFAQTWENGLLCLDSQTGAVIWRTKSKRGITSIFVNKETILCHQREHALQLLDIHTGEVILEKRPATAWGFTALDHQHIICQVNARRWEIMDATTLETKASFAHKEFTGGHEDYTVNRIEKMPEGRILVSGFKNAWDRSVTPAAMLPNLTFEHFVDVTVLE